MEGQNKIVRFYDFNMETTSPDICLSRLRTKLSNIPEIVVHFSFRNYHEIHHFCEDNMSPYPEDHNVVFREFVEGSSFEAALAFLLMPETVEWYLARAKLRDDWPTAEYVSGSCWEEVKSRVLEYLLKMADFESKVGFEMVAELDVATLLTPCSWSLSSLSLSGGRLI